MLDKLALASPREITLEDASQQLEGEFTFITTTATRYHEKVYVYHRGAKRPEDHLITIHSEPRSANISPTKIELNPSRFENFEALYELLSKVANPELLAVSRLDHAVDISVPIKDVHSCLLFSRKKSREVYADGHNLTGFYLGKYPEQLVVYDRGLKAGGTSDQVTRIELRQHREKIPVSNFSELPECQRYKPFARIEFSSVKPLSTLKDCTKAQLLEEAIARLGAQGAYKVFNSHSNFRRDFRGCLERPAAIPDLDSIYRGNLSQFFSHSGQEDEIKRHLKKTTPLPNGGECA